LELKIGKSPPSQGRPKALKGKKPEANIWVTGLWYLLRSPRMAYFWLRMLYDCSIYSKKLKG